MPLNCLERDLDATFASSGFGEADGAVRNGDSSDPIPGIFDNEDVETQNGEGVVIIVPTSVFTCALSRVPNLTDGDIFLIRGVSYIARSWKRDGAGMVDIFMEDPT